MNQLQRRALVAALALPFAIPAVAASPATVAVTAAATAADVIVVTGQRDEYGVRATSTATKTKTPVRDIPQAMTVISEKQIEDQGLRSISDLLFFVPGATPGTGEANRDQFTLRGNNTTADFFVDGVRDDVQYFRDLYNVDRVEVLRGSNAMIFGRGGGGGVVNRVTKRSSLNAYNEFSASGDSEGGVRLTGDIDQPLGKNIGLRVNGMFEEGNSFRRNVDLDRYAINPTLGILVGPATRIDLSYEYAHDRRTADRGVPARNDRPLKGFDKVFFGDPDASYSKSDINVATFALEHDFAPGLTLRHRTLVGDYDKFYQNIYPSDFLETGPTTDNIVLGAYNSRNDRRSLFSQTDLIWENRLGGIEQTILIGTEFGRQTSRNLRLTGSFLGGDNRVPLSDPTVSSVLTYANSASDANNHTRATIAAVYIQDQIKPAPWLEIVAGIRFDRFKLEVDDFHGAGARFERRDDLVSPRIGVILKPLPRLSLYTAYSRSFLPQSGDQSGGLTLTTQSLKPERFDNYEIGAKWEPVAGLLATAAIYRLDRTNTRAAGAVAGTTVLTGAQRSRGLELGLERSISDRWQVSAGYAWQDAEIRETTTAAPAGRKVALVPRHTFSLWNRYDVTRSIGFGLGVVSRSSSFASISNAVKLPAYTRVDAAAFFKLARGVRAQVNVENLFGVDYFPTAHSDNNIAPGAPRTAHATLRLNF